MRRWDYFAAILLISLVLNSLFTGGERRAPVAEAPRRPPPTVIAHPPAPQAPSPGLPLSRVEHKMKSRSTAGTAFAVDDVGTWLTARHVVDGCDRVGIIYDHKTKRAERMTLRAVHSNADVAVLSGRVPGNPRPVALAAALDGETEAFHVGYPKGRRAVLHSAYLGRWRLVGFGRFRNDEEVAVWGVISRFPADLPGFAGISGGPVFSADGRVIGISVAGSDRRGRVIASLPRSFHQALDAAGGTPPPRPGDLRFTGADYRAVGERLLDGLRVARVFCKVTTTSKTGG
ncbi:serine protease [Thalassospiraceae bacterium LMO-SO8]|nr:serine protease [Alphaproteobacteria bacterium LMO-S08]WND76962.1 serine protease [Thalassospiraceae bacterium LMO-SO8]